MVNEMLGLFRYDKQDSLLTLFSVRVILLDNCRIALAKQEHSRMSRKEPHRPIELAVL